MLQYDTACWNECRCLERIVPIGNGDIYIYTVYIFLLYACLVILMDATGGETSCVCV